MVWRIIANRLVLACQIWKRRPDLALLDTYTEYFAPLWVWPHWFLARVSRIRYAAGLRRGRIHCRDCRRRLREMTPETYRKRAGSAH